MRSKPAISVNLISPALAEFFIVAHKFILEIIFLYFLYLFYSYLLILLVALIFLLMQGLWIWCIRLPHNGLCSKFMLNFSIKFIKKVIISWTS